MNNRKKILEEIIDQTTNTDSSFKIGFINGFAVLTVYPAMGKGKIVYPETVSARLKLLNVPSVSPELINTTVNQASGIPVKLIEWPDGNKYKQEYSITITDDNIKCYISISKPKFPDICYSSDEIIEILTGQRIKNLLYDNIYKIINNNIYDEKILVSSGIHPINGTTGDYKLLFNTIHGKPFKFDEYGRANLKELNFISNVKAGQVIAEIFLPIAGKDGFNIYGEVLKHSISDVKTFKIGKNIKQENNTIISLVDGNAYLRDNIIGVEPLIELNNIDYSTGNIDFDGSVVIKGTIADGFELKATGDIEVGSFLGRVKIIGNKNILIRSGINGNNDAYLEAGGDIYAKYIEQTKLVAKGSLFVEELILHSDIQVDNNLILKGKRAEIIGGNIIAGGNVWSKKIGSQNGVKTNISAGIKPEKINELVNIEVKLKEMNNNIIELNNKKNYLESHQTIEGYSEDEVKRAISKLNILIEQKKRSLDDLNAEFKLIKENMKPENCTVVCESSIFPGVVISFGKEELKITNVPVNKTVYKYSNGILKEYGFNYREPPKI